jgi:hypothetical protein
MDKKMFWEDVQQAQDRLSGTYVLHGDKVVFVERCENRDRLPSARCLDTIASSTAWYPLTDEAFHDFHKLPPLGYVNITRTGYPHAVLLQRLPERSRSHGLKTNRISVSGLVGPGLAPSAYNYDHIVVDKGYGMAIRGEYPTAKEILDNLDEDTSAAFSPSYAISRDSFGILRLFRKQLMIGVIDEEVVKFARTTDCYREELQQTTTFDIREG